MLADRSMTSTIAIACLSTSIGSSLIGLAPAVEPMRGGSAGGGGSLGASSGGAGSLSADPPPLPCSSPSARSTGRGCTGRTARSGAPSGPNAPGSTNSPAPSCTASTTAFCCVTDSVRPSTSLRCRRQSSGSSADARTRSPWARSAAAATPLGSTTRTSFGGATSNRPVATTRWPPTTTASDAS